jgi:hypothetical protein
MAKTREKFAFYAALKNMVDALINSRFDPPIPLANLTDLSYFPGHIITDPKPTEPSFFIQLIDFSKGFFEGRLPVWAMEVEHVDLLTFQRFETL